MIFEKVKNLRFLLTAIIIFILIPDLYAGDKPVKGNIAVFYIPQQNIQMNALAEKSTQMAITVFESLGRFLPVERNRITWALKGVSKKSGLKTYEEVAKRLEVDLYAIVAVYRRGSVFYGQLKVFTLSKKYKTFSKNIVVNSRLATNVPLKIGREVAYYHKNLPVFASVTGKIGDRYIISAGQWHGLKKEKYRTDLDKKIKIYRTERYYSIVESSPPLKMNQDFTIYSKPAIKSIVKQIEDDIYFNTEHKYGLKNTLLRNRDVTKKYMQGFCVINPGANFCLPGYGAHLATRYMGFEKISPSIPGIVLTSSLFAVHLMLTPMMTGFNKGVELDDHPKALVNLQIFMWATIPLTWTVGYMDQLAHQFKMTKHLPPFFYHRNITAALFSFFIPGGGLFYKGYRLAGWSYYLAEMSLLSFAVYSYEDDKDAFMYTMIAVGVLKLAELINAFFVKSDYDFYNFEKNRKIEKNTISFGIVPFGNDNRFSLAFVHRFN